MDDFEETFVLDDLLSFLSCKLNKFPKELLFKRIREFYSIETISSSLKTLLESLPNSYDFPDKKADPLDIMFECLHVLPEEDKPVFLCRNLDNVPKLTCDQLYTSEWCTDAIAIKDEQHRMKNQLENIFIQVELLKTHFGDAQDKLLKCQELSQDKDVAVSLISIGDQTANEKARQTSSQQNFNGKRLSPSKTKVPGPSISKKIIFVQEEGKLRMIKPC